VELTRPDETGIDARWTAEVSDEMQSRVASAFPDMRIVWNNSLTKYQAVLQSEGCLTVFQEGTLVGWEIIGEFEPGESIDVIISTLRGRQHFVAYKLRKMGYGTENDSDSDVMNAYLDDSDRIAEEAVEKLYDDAINDYMDGAFARARDEKEVLRKRIIRLGDLNTNRRAHAATKLVIPCNPAGVTRILRAKA